MKRLLTLLLVLAMVVTLFAACAEPATTQAPQGTQEQTQGTGEKETSDKDKDEWGRPLVESSLASDLKFDGEQVNIFVEAGRMEELYAEEYTDDLINDSIYNRNIKVETDLDVKLNFIEATTQMSDFVADVGTIVAAGTNDYDIAVGYAYSMVAGVTSMNYSNLYDIPNLDLTKPWWNQDYVKESTLGGQLYTITGDLALSATYGTGCLFFNKRLADEEYASLGGSEYLYQLVLDNKWTIDTFTDLVKNKFREMDGDGVPSEGDFFGFGSWLAGPIPCDPLAIGMGAFVTQDNAEGVPEFVFDGEHTVNVLNKLYALFADSEGVLYNKKYYNDFEAYTMIENKFINGSMIFHAGTLSTASGFLNMEDDYGLLPMPKFDEKQEKYLTTTNDGYLLLTIPFGIDTSDRAGMVGATLEKLAEESYRTVAPNYFEVVMKYRYIRSEDETDYDLQMYDIILQGNTFNFGMVYSIAMDDPAFAFRHLLGRDGSRNFASYWGAKRTTVRNKFDNLVEWFLEE